LPGTRARTRRAGEAGSKVARLLAAYDAEVRLAVPDPLPPGVAYEWDGPVLRSTGGRRGFVVARDLTGTDEAELDELIARQIRHYAARGEEFEWKTWSHVGPAVLTDRLVAAGFQPGPVETVLLAVAAPLTRDPPLPEGVRLRTGTADDLAGIAALYEVVWSEDQAARVAALGRRLVTTPASLDLVVAEHDGRVIGSGRVDYEGGSRFASLWGGSVHPDWRHRGVYRASVAWRARLAVAHGKSALQADAAPTSRPILERLGFVVAASTTPYVRGPADPLSETVPILNCQVS
jgi:predicted N-acetyltransferase YhbS